MAVSRRADYHRLPDSHSVTRLVEENRGLITYVLRRYFTGVVYDRFEREDLESEGLIALMLAAQKYDPLRGYRFSTFAVRCICTRLRNYLKVPKKALPPGGVMGLLSLDALASGSSHNGATVGELLPDLSPSIELRVVQSAQIALIWACAEAALDARSLRIFRLVYDGGFTLVEVSRIVGGSASQVAMLHRAALYAVRQQLAGNAAASVFVDCPGGR